MSIEVFELLFLSYYLLVIPRKNEVILYRTSFFHYIWQQFNIPVAENSEQVMAME